MAKRRKASRKGFVINVQVGENEKPKILKVYASVKRAVKPVEVVLTAEHVRESIRRKGVGNTELCAMATCVRHQPDAFPHPVTGFIEWGPRTAHVVVKNDPVTGLPLRCVAYQHHDKIARLNDSKGGQQKLLKDLEENGPKTIRLYPITARGPRPPKVHSPGNGERTKRLGTGAKHRAAFATLGGAL